MAHEFVGISFYSSIRGIHIFVFVCIHETWARILCVFVFAEREVGSNLCEEVRGYELIHVDFCLSFDLGKGEMELEKAVVNGITCLALKLYTSPIATIKLLDLIMIFRLLSKSSYMESEISALFIDWG